jgi:hypothetical protein
MSPGGQFLMSLNSQRSRPARLSAQGVPDSDSSALRRPLALGSSTSRPPRVPRPTPLGDQAIPCARLSSSFPEALATPFWLDHPVETLGDSRSPCLPLEPARLKRGAPLIPQAPRTAAPYPGMSCAFSSARPSTARSSGRSPRTRFFNSFLAAGRPPPGGRPPGIAKGHPLAGPVSRAKPI